MIKYLKENKQWIFSGIGVSGITLIVGIVWYMLPGRRPETKPPMPAPSNTQPTVSPSIVRKLPSPTRTPSKEPVPTKASPDSTPEPDNRQSNNEEEFNRLLKEARKLLELGHPAPACRLYRQAVDLIPASKRGEVKFGLIGEASARYDREDFPTAAKKYAEAFQKVSIQ
jgi:hypothetical protein